ncbi:Pr6Pr family membrane protein [Sphingomonas daechungensis]
MPRLLAVIIALTAWVGLGIQFYATFGTSGSVLETLWIILRFFTITTNLIVAVTMTAVALDRRVSSFIHAGVTLAIGLVGVVYVTLLRGLLQLEGAALIADTILHYAVPIMTVLYWIAIAPKYGLRWQHSLLWSLYPLAYFAYAIVRGSIDGRYPYPFMNLAELGPARTALNAVGLAIAFVIAGVLMVAFSRLAGRNRGRPLG